MRNQLSSFVTALAVTLCISVASANASTRCTSQVVVNGDSVDLLVDIEGPRDGGEISSGESCQVPVPIWGTVRATLHRDQGRDIYIVLDCSASTFTPLGFDLNHDGMVDDYFDTLYYGQLRSAELFVASLPSMVDRVSLILFSDDDQAPSLRPELALTGDLARVIDHLRNLQTQSVPLWMATTLHENGLDPVTSQLDAQGAAVADREQRVLFFSDGANMGTQAAYDAAMDNLTHMLGANGSRSNSARSVIVDSFSIGNVFNTWWLTDMAQQTGGLYTEVFPASDLLTVFPNLPQFGPYFPVSVTASAIPLIQRVSVEMGNGEYSFPFDLQAGWSQLTIDLQPLDDPSAPPLSCSTDVFVSSAPPQDLDGRLEIRKTAPGATHELEATYDRRTALRPHETNVLTQKYARDEALVMSSAGTTTSRTAVIPAQPDRSLIYFDARTRSCDGSISQE